MSNVIWVNRPAVKGIESARFNVGRLEFCLRFESISAFLKPEKLAGETGKEKWRVKYYGRLSPFMLVMLTMMMVLNSC